MAEAYGDVRLAGEDVDYFVAEAEVDDDVRVTGGESCDQRHNGQPSMAKGGTDTQAALGYALVGNGPFHFVHVGENSPGTAQEGLALDGKRQRAGRAQQQTSAESLFGAGDDPTDRRRRQPQRTRSR